MHQWRNGRISCHKPSQIYPGTPINVQIISAQWWQYEGLWNDFLVKKWPCPVWSTPPLVLPWAPAPRALSAPSLSAEVRRSTSSSKLLLSPPVPDNPPLPLPVNSEPAMLRLRRIGSWPAPATNRPPRPPPAPPPPPLGRRERDVVGSGWLIDWLHGAIPENDVALRPYRVKPHRNPRPFGIIQKYE